MTIAILGYLMYGDDVESEITLNLPTSKVSGRVAIYTTLLIPVTRYSLLVAPIATAIEGGLSEKYKNQKPVRLLIRVALLISTVIVAYVFPYYESLMAIVGWACWCECLARLAIPDKIPKCPLTQLSYSYSDYLTLKTKTLLRGRGVGVDLSN
ncbi:Amino acid transporter AVT1J [Vitis vinifera]|uniref:Amino acid transporter AVT1J n=1 Tax=Vitis vinifera TaxID=29760 RepID=A0A438HYV7_VITVI|nr:Amino acid transporter AVT1J [Vitis vinifera]